jgi:hypothetical protein
MAEYAEELESYARRVKARETAYRLGVEVCFDDYGRHSLCHHEPPHWTTSHGGVEERTWLLFLSARRQGVMSESGVTSATNVNSSALRC